MREILFKAKRIDNGLWVEGFYTYCNGKHYIRLLTDETSRYTKSFFEVDPSTICQYTGLTDKNGQKIWENDVVRYTDMISGVEKIDRIEWNETNASFVRLHKSQMGLQYLYIDEFIANRCEIIGSAIENPELIEK